MMHMTFYWGTKMTLLFDSWKTDSFLSYALSLLTLFLVSVFYQYLEDRRLRFLSTGIKGRPPPSIHEPLLSAGARVAVSARVVTAVLVGVNSVIGYLLMLAVMTFNWGVLIVVVLGFGFGYFCFRCQEYEALVVQDPCACD